MQLIQFEGRTVAVIAPEDLEELEHKNAKLREAQVALLRNAPLGYECDNFDHRKADRHKLDEPCPCLKRWLDSRNAAAALLNIAAT